MWHTTCCYCHKEIKEMEACYPVHENGKKEYRHVNCYPEEVKQPSDYAKPFGEVTDEDTWKGA